MLKNIIIQAYFFFSYLLGYGQNVEISGEFFLPEVLKESSGILFVPPNRLLHINDSGNPPEILVTDTNGTLIQKYCLPGLENVDWEDLAYDQKGNLFIGDFGNNLNRRKDLKIYKVEAEKVLEGDDSFSWKEIHFRYSDQYGFPPDQQDRNFDMEAMIHLNDSLYLFSKNRSSPFNGYTYCYKLPDFAGEFVAEKIDSFFTGEGIMESFWITGADYRSNPPTLLLVGYDKLWMFYHFTGNNFFNGKHDVLYFNSFTQKEGVTFFTDNNAMVSDEKNRSTDGKVYILRLPIVKSFTPILKENNSHYQIIKEPLDLFSREIMLVFNCDTVCQVDWEVFNAKGQRLHYGEEMQYPPGSHQISIPSTDWNNGNYTFHLIIDGLVHAFEIKKVRKL